MQMFSLTPDGGVKDWGESLATAFVNWGTAFRREHSRGGAMFGFGSPAATIPVRVSRGEVLWASAHS